MAATLTKTAPPAPALGPLRLATQQHRNNSSQQLFRGLRLPASLGWYGRLVFVAACAATWSRVVPRRLSVALAFIYAAWRLATMPRRNREKKSNFPSKTGATELAAVGLCVDKFDVVTRDGTIVKAYVFKPKAFDARKSRAILLANGLGCRL